jgi:hypothetical protein
MVRTPANPEKKHTPAKYNKEAVRAAAAGHWQSILTAAGLPPDCLSGKNGPCPKCEGKDRFAAFADVDETGGVNCRKCHNINNGDGFATVQWWRNCTFPEAITFIAEQIGLEPGKGGKTGPKWEVLRETPGALDLHVRDEWARAKPGVDVTSIERAGGRAAKYKSSKNKESGVLFFEVWHPDWKTRRGAIYYFNSGGHARLIPKSEPGFVRVCTPEEHQAAETVWLCEGVSDACALAPLLPPTAVCVSVSHGAGKFDAFMAVVCHGKRLVIAFDADDPGRKGTQKVFHQCQRTATEIRVLQLPDGMDVREYKNAGHSFADFESCLSGPIQSLEALFGRPIIAVTTDEFVAVDQAIDALAKESSVYQRGGVLVHIVRDLEPPKGVTRGNAPRIAEAKQPFVQEELSRVAKWQKTSGDNIEDIHPPKWATQAVIARGEWRGIKPLAAVTEAPVMRPDGSILQASGYDVQTGLFFAPQVEFPPVADSPTRDDAIRAAESLMEIVVDFPLSATYKATWLAALLTPFARLAFDGPAPLFLVDANVAGTGKGLLVDTIAIIVTGKRMPRTVAPREDEEMRKRITAIAMAGEQLIVFDNVVGSFGCASIDAALTGDTWSDRILGESRTTGHLPLTTTWFVTANNIILVGDTVRRTAHIRLESNLEHPEERQDFRYTDLLQWVHQNRGQLAVAALTILRAFWIAGRPRSSARPWGSFEGWSGLIRAAVIWIGFKDPAAESIRRELREVSDQGVLSLKLLHDGWIEADPHSNGLSVSEAIEQAKDIPSLRHAFEMLTGRKDYNALHLGKRIASTRNRIVDNKKLILKNDKDKKGKIWIVHDLNRGDLFSPGDESEDRDDFLAPSQINQGNQKQEYATDNNMAGGEKFVSSVGFVSTVNDAYQRDYQEALNSCPPGWQKMFAARCQELIDDGEPLAGLPWRAKSDVRAHYEGRKAIK